MTKKHVSKVITINASSVLDFKGYLAEFEAKTGLDFVKTNAKTAKLDGQYGVLVSIDYAPVFLLESCQSAQVAMDEADRNDYMNDTLELFASHLTKFE